MLVREESRRVSETIIPFGSRSSSGAPLRCATGSLPGYRFASRVYEGGLYQLSKCLDRNEFDLRPDVGRKFGEIAQVSVGKKNLGETRPVRFESALNWTILFIGRKKPA